MRLGIVSDVHCQAEALEWTAERMTAQGVDEILLAGDAHFEYRFSDEVVDLIRAYQMRYVRGNHEAVLLGPHGRRALERPGIRPANVEFVRAAPWNIRMPVGGGKTLLMVHANPWEHSFDYLYDGDAHFDRCAELNADYLVLGHTHVPMHRRHGGTVVINPGSLAFSTDRESAGKLVYALLDTDADVVEIVREFATDRLCRTSR